MSVERLKAEITKLNACLRDKNIALDAMAWVWCDGGCDGGAGRYTDLEITEDMVVAAERNTKRLRRWFNNFEFKKKWAKMSADERTEWFAERRKNDQR